MKKKAVYTTGQVAKICNLSQQTIIRCFDSGKIDGFRVPGSRFRRVPHESLMRFLAENDIPVPEFNSRKIKILIVDNDPATVNILADALETDGRFEVQIATNAYDAGLRSLEFLPAIFLVDFLLPNFDAAAMCKAVRRTERLNNSHILLYSSLTNTNDIANIIQAGADDFLPKPTPTAELIRHLATVGKK